MKPSWFQAFLNWLRRLGPREVSTPTNTPPPDVLNFGSVESAHQTDTERSLHPSSSEGQANAQKVDDSQIPSDPPSGSDLGVASVTVPRAVPAPAAPVSPREKRDESTSLANIPNAVDVERALSELMKGKMTNLARPQNHPSTLQGVVGGSPQAASNLHAHLARCDPR